MPDDRLGFSLIEREPCLADCAMVSTGYPHSFRLWPHRQETVARHKVLAGNAMRVSFPG